jgi:hypothetical protein
MACVRGRRFRRRFFRRASGNPAVRSFEGTGVSWGRRSTCLTTGAPPDLPEDTLTDAGAAREPAGELDSL